MGADGPDACFLVTVDLAGLGWSCLGLIHSFFEHSFFDAVLNATCFGEIILIAVAVSGRERDNACC